MKKLLLLTIFMVTMISSAQVKLTGVVKDSIGETLEMANVLAINKITKKWRLMVLQMQKEDIS